MMDPRGFLWGQICIEAVSAEALSEKHCGTFRKKSISIGSLGISLFQLEAVFK